MPDQADVDPTRIPKHVLPFINLTDVSADGRFKSRLAGTKVVALSGLEITGRYIDEISGTEDMLRQFRRLVQSGKPYHCTVPLTWSALNYKWCETVVCPLADDTGRQVGRLISATAFD